MNLVPALRAPPRVNSTPPRNLAGPENLRGPPLPAASAAADASPLCPCAADDGGHHPAEPHVPAGPAHDQEADREPHRPRVPGARFSALTFLPSVLLLRLFRVATRVAHAQLSACRQGRARDASLHTQLFRRAFCTVECWCAAEMRNCSTCRRSRTLSSTWHEQGLCAPGRHEAASGHRLQR